MQIESILKRLAISSLNEMQQEVLDRYKMDQDFVLLSPTGTGKTLAFSLLIAQKLQANYQGVQCLIIVPTRELALQIEQVLKKVMQGFKITCCYGGHSTKIERNTLKEAPAILIGTPGRIAHHIEAGNFEAAKVHTLVMDEFDKSLELGFQDQISMITAYLHGLNHRILTSATNMEELPAFTGVSNPIYVNYLNQAQSAPKITYKKVTSPVHLKLKSLLNLLCKLGGQKVIIFCNHRDAVDHISELLEDRELIHDTFHGGLEQIDRELALLKFRNKSNQILITTDLAARGLDIPEVDAIIHYQLPTREDAFIHRNGRTARMEAKGTVYLLLKPEDDFAYLPEEVQEEDLTETYPLPANTPYTTLYFNAGKKDKINKIDIVGYLLNLAGIQKEDVGVIEIKDHEAYAAVDRKVAAIVLKRSTLDKIKGRKIKIQRT